jgi:hypothetical protein
VPLLEQLLLLGIGISSFVELYFTAQAKSSRANLVFVIILLLSVYFGLRLTDGVS